MKLDVNSFIETEKVFTSCKKNMSEGDWCKEQGKNNHIIVLDRHLAPLKVEIADLYDSNKKRLILVKKGRTSKTIRDVFGQFCISMLYMQHEKTKYHEFLTKHNIRTVENISFGLILPIKNNSFNFCTYGPPSLIYFTSKLIESMGKKFNIIPINQE